MAWSSDEKGGGSILAALAMEEANSEDPERYRLWHRERIRRTAALVRKYVRVGGPVLDVGLGPLTIEFETALSGYPLSVLDPAEGTGLLPQTSKTKIIRGSLLDPILHLPSSAFQAIVVAEVMEHLPECPEHVLGRLLPALSPEGVLIVTTPNQARWLNRIRLLLGVNIQERPRNLFHKEWMGFGHIREYTLQEMSTEFLVGGLVPLEVGSWSPHPLPRFDWVRRAFERFGPASMDQVIYGVYHRSGTFT